MRLFFAIGLPEGIRAKLEDVLRELKEMGLQASILKKEQLHVTLLFLGEKKGSEATEIIGKMNKLDFTPFQIKIKAAGFFPDERRPRVFWIGAEAEKGGLANLHGKICTTIGVPEEKNFSGHVTLARIRGGKNIQKFIDLERELQGIEFGSFAVNEVMLMDSTLSPSGPEYRVVGRFRGK